MSLVLNMVQHQLTPEQRTELEKYGNIVDGREYLPTLWPKIANSPSSGKDLRKLARELYVTLLGISEEKKVYMHLPLGSPAFMFQFGMIVGSMGKWENMHFLFSHTERCSIDEKQEDGSVIKKSVFQFIKFIEF